MQGMKQPFMYRSMPFIVCGLAALFYLYDYFVQVSPAVITNELMRAFHMGAAGLSFLGACFFYAYAGMQIPAGLLLDRFGARRILTFAVLISGLGVIIFGLSHNFLLAGLARFCIGFGSAFAFISTLFLAARWFEHRYFTLIAGLVQFAGCLGSVMGEAPLARFINHFGWRETMVITGLITIILSTLYWTIIRDYRSNSPLALNAANLHKTKIMGFSQEWIRLKTVLRIPQVWWVGLTGFFSWAPAGVIGALWGVPYFMKCYGWTNIQAAGLCSIFWITVGVSSPLIGWFSDYIQKRRVPCYLAFGCSLVGSILIVLAPYLSLGMTILGLVLLGICPALQSLTFGIIKDILPFNIFGTAAGFNNMMAIAAGAIAQQIVGWLLVITWNHQMLHGIPDYTLGNYQLAILVLPIGTLLGLLISLFKIKETNCEHLESLSSAQTA